MVPTRKQPVFPQFSGSATPQHASLDQEADAGDSHSQSGATWTTVYTDGGSRGNPGPAGHGVLVQAEDGTVLAELSQYLGVRTNNYAEYSGLLAALEYALAHGHRRLRVYSDSELMVRQVRGEYKVKSPDLRPLYEEAKRRIARLEAFEVRHVLRGKNKRADQLANAAMDRGDRRGPRQVTGDRPETAFRSGQRRD